MTQYSSPSRSEPDASEVWGRFPGKIINMQQLIINLICYLQQGRLQHQTKYVDWVYRLLEAFEHLLGGSRDFCTITLVQL